MAKNKLTSGSEFYKKAGFKPVIVHVTKETHEALSSLAKLEQRSLQIVARALLERAAKDPEKALRAVNEYVRQTGRP